MKLEIWNSYHYSTQVATPSNQHCPVIRSHRFVQLALQDRLQHWVHILPQTAQCLTLFIQHSFLVLPVALQCSLLFTARCNCILPSAVQPKAVTVHVADSASGSILRQWDILPVDVWRPGSLMISPRTMMIWMISILLWWDQRLLDDIYCSSTPNRRRKKLNRRNKTATS